MPWSKDPDRRRGLPAHIKTQVMRIHDGRCHICGHDAGDNIDHIINVATWLREQRSGSPDDLSNLAPIHQQTCPTCGRRCHTEKTAGEAQRPPRRRPAERHPGLLK